MRRTEVLQGLKCTRLEAICRRWQRRQLSQAEVPEVLWMGERTFRRWRDRYHEEGLNGLHNRWLGRTSTKRMPVDQVKPYAGAVHSRYIGFTINHFHDKMRQHCGAG